MNFLITSIFIILLGIIFIYFSKKYKINKIRYVLFTISQIFFVVGFAIIYEFIEKGG